MAKAGKRYIMAVKHIIVTNRDNKAFVFKSEEMKDNKYVEFQDESTTMASLNAVIEVLENIPEDSSDLHIVLLPKCLGLMLKLDQPAKIRDNGYKTEKGAALTQEFVDLMCYANELRAWLTTNVVRLKLHGSSLLFPNEVKMIKNAWDRLDAIVKPERPSNNYERPENKPERPNNFVEVTMEDIQF